MKAKVVHVFFISCKIPNTVFTISTFKNVSMGSENMFILYCNIYLFFYILKLNCISLSEWYIVSRRHCGFNSETKYASENEML